MGTDETDYSDIDRRTRRMDLAERLGLKRELLAMIGSTPDDEEAIDQVFADLVMEKTGENFWP